MKMTKLDREMTVYGIAVNEKSGLAFCFNADYFVLYRRPTRAEVEAIKQGHEHVTHGRAHGRGRFKCSIEDESEWTTYWVRLPEPLEWFNLGYPQQHYLARDSAWDTGPVHGHGYWVLTAAD